MKAKRPAKKATVLAACETGFKAKARAMNERVIAPETRIGSMIRREAAVALRRRTTRIPIADTTIATPSRLKTTFRTSATVWFPQIRIVFLGQFVQIASGSSWNGRGSPEARTAVT